MRRDLDQLENNKFDVLIVGAGIYGISIARDAVLRGLDVCLIDANDFGSGTSHNSLKIIHGGIRYFQHLNFKRVLESIHEREMWAQVSKRFIKPLKFVIPTYGYASRGPLALALAVNMHNLFAAAQKLHRQQKHYPSGHMLSRSECCELLPATNDENITGGAVWYDGQIVDADRLHIELLKDAYDKGLCLANYIRAEEILVAAGKTSGAHVVDQVSGAAFDIQASLVVNATGPWAYSLLKPSLKDKHKYINQPLSKNFNIVIDSLDKDYAFGVKSKRSSDAVVGSSKRVYFFTPWLNKTVIGTAHLPHQVAGSNDFDVSKDVSVFVDEINEACPSLSLNQNDIRYVYSGLTPAENVDAAREVSRSHHTSLIDHAVTDNVDNLLSVIGVKYTTARSAAQKIVDIIVSRLARDLKTPLKQVPLNYAINEINDDFSSMDDLCLEAFPSQASITSIYREHIKEHVDNAVENEMVLSLEDYVLRRNNLAMRGLLTKEDLIPVTKGLVEKLGLQEDELNKQLRDISSRLTLATSNELN